MDCGVVETGRSKKMSGSILNEPRCDRCYGLNCKSAKPIFFIPKIDPKAKRLLEGHPRNRHVPSLRCVAEPHQEGYLGSYFFVKEFARSMSEGLMPSGSLWLNDHTQEVFEVYGADLEPQELLLVGPDQLKLPESRFPRLKRAISSPALY